MKTLRYAVLALALSGAIVALLPAQDPADDDEAQRIAANDRAAVAKANNEFALELYRHVMDEPGNIFFSPYSISTALAMTMAGARGDTEAQMAETLRLTLERDLLHTAVGRMIDEINKAGAEGEFDLAVANALWGQRGYDFRREFIDFGQERYGAGFNEVDCERDTEEARQTINAWVERRTNDLIKELIKPGILTPMTTLVLTNAIYFKGDWVRAFDPELTRDAPFSLFEDGAERRINVPMMYQEADFLYRETEDVQILELPYEGDRLAMVVVLPKKRGGLGELEASLTSEKLAGYIRGPRSRRTQGDIHVYLPRFKMEWEASLGETLQKMGMTDAFDPGKADLTGMTPRRELYISAVVHKAFVDVNEEGTEAAAATAVIIEKEAAWPPPTVFRADHPFLFFIRDNETGAMLFMGRVADPSK